jgi:hypothetical protein
VYVGVMCVWCVDAGCVYVLYLYVAGMCVWCVVCVVLFFSISHLYLFR